MPHADCLYSNFKIYETHSGSDVLFKLFILTFPLISDLTSAEPSWLSLGQCRGSHVRCF